MFKPYTNVFRCSKCVQINENSYKGLVYISTFGELVAELDRTSATELFRAELHRSQVLVLAHLIFCTSISRILFTVYCVRSLSFSVFYFST